ncbi:MAG: response regulator [Nitrospirae bacterium]|nr:response regulator [Nitrospirota bacterium]
MKSQINIIVAENDNNFNQLIQESLQKEGFHVIGVFNGKDTIDKVAENQDSVLLLDCDLPDMTAGQVIETLSERKCSVPYILIIEHGNEKTAIELMKMGASNYIIKEPVFKDMIPILVKKVLKGLEWEKEIVEVEEILQKRSYLNQIILDRMPCITLLLESYTREIIASNAAATKIGAVPGKKCFSTWVQREDPCPWCRAPILWESGEEQRLEFEASGSTWDAYWVPVEKNMYLHYAFKISDCIH